MEKKKLFIVIGLLVLASFFLFFFIHKKAAKPENKQESAACKTLKDDVLKEIGNMNFCKEAKDCVLVNGCPHGCNNLVNKDADWAKLNDLSFGYADKCGECTEQCQGALRGDQIGCVDGKCVRIN